MWSPALNGGWHTIWLTQDKPYLEEELKRELMKKSLETDEPEEKIDAQEIWERINDDRKKSILPHQGFGE